MDDLDERIVRLLDQLEKPGLSESEQKRIQEKIKFLKSLRE